MKQLVIKGIVLARTNYGEADRIITMLTPSHGKVRLMARGVRRSKSKLASGIELFSVSDVTLIKGKGDIDTLTSARLAQYYGGIVEDIDRTMLGYELIKQIHRATEDECGEEYFTLLQQSFEALSTQSIATQLVQSWFQAQLLKIGGHMPNLHTDTTSHELAADKTYMFQYEDAAFLPHDKGGFGAQHIKFLRLLFSDTQPQVLARVGSHEALLQECARLIQTMRNTYIQV